MNTSRGSPNGSDKLRDAERAKCRLINCRCDLQSVVGLERCDGVSGHRSKNTIDRSIVWVISIRVITPCREPVAGIPVIPAAVHKDDPIVMAPPPTAIVPLSVVIAKSRILLAAKRTAP